MLITVALGIFALALLGFCLLFVTAPRNYEDRCLALKQRLHPLHASLVSQFVMPADSEFVTASRGIAGVYEWGVASAVLICLLQMSVRAGKVSASDGWDAHQEALLQFYYSLLAVPEAIIGAAWSRLSHPNAQMAFTHHYRFRLRCSTLLAYEGAPEHLRNGGMML